MHGGRGEQGGRGRGLVPQKKRRKSSYAHSVTKQAHTHRRSPHVATSHSVAWKGIMVSSLMLEPKMRDTLGCILSPIHRLFFIVSVSLLSFCLIFLRGILAHDEGRTQSKMDEKSRTSAGYLFLLPLAFSAVLADRTESAFDPARPDVRSVYIPT